MDTVAPSPPADKDPESGAARPVVSLDRRIDLLRRQRAFASLPTETLDRIAGLLQEVRIAAGTEVVREGDTGDRLYIIVTGRAEVITTRDERPVHIGTLGDGTLFGELALIDQTRKRQATVIAQTDLLALFLVAEDFEHVAKDYPGVRRVFTTAARGKKLVKFMHVHMLYRLHFQNPRRERLFLGSLAFFLGFGAVRGIATLERIGVGPFRDVTPGGTHIHHLVWGILLLLAVGYLWLAQIGTGGSGVWFRLTAILYGVGAGITLDEFALWLNLKDVYWQTDGRQSIDAVIFFGGLLSVGFWGGPFFRALVQFLVPRRESQSHI